MNAFLLDNILLIAIICVCVVSLAWPYVAKRRWGPEVDNRSATELINHKNAQIVDLRDPADFKRNALPARLIFPPTVFRTNSVSSIRRARCFSSMTTAGAPGWLRPF